MCHHQTGKRKWSDCNEMSPWCDIFRRWQLLFGVRSVKNFSLRTSDFLVISYPNVPMGKAILERSHCTGIRIFLEDLMQSFYSQRAFFIESFRLPILLKYFKIFLNSWYQFLNLQEIYICWICVLLNAIYTLKFKVISKNIAKNIFL